jgi:hypothetical protein
MPPPPLVAVPPGVMEPEPTAAAVEGVRLPGVMGLANPDVAPPPTPADLDGLICSHCWCWCWCKAWYWCTRVPTREALVGVLAPLTLRELASDLLLAMISLADGQ